MHDQLGDIGAQPPHETRRFIHRRIGGAVVGFARGGFAGAASGFITRGRSTRPTSTITPGAPGRTTFTSTRIGPFGALFKQDIRTTTVGQGVAVGRDVNLQIGGGASRLAQGPVLPTADGCPKGFHLNKSSYSLKDGTRIEERSLCVKNRRRNNDNGVAALRAARRLLGRKKHQETIDKALGKIAPPRRRSSSKKAVPAGATIVSTAG